MYEVIRGILFTIDMLLYFLID